MFSLTMNLGNTHIGTELPLINQRMYCDAIAKLGVKPNIDLLASRLNYKLKPFEENQPDPEAFAIDAFTLSWESYLFYAFPPFSLVALVIISHSEHSGGGGHRTYSSTHVANSTMMADTNENSNSKSAGPASEKRASISAKPTRLSSSTTPKASTAAMSCIQEQLEIQGLS